MTLHTPQETLSPAGPVIHELDPADLLDDSDSTIDDPNLMPQDLCEAVVNEDAHSPLSYCSSSEKGGKPGPQELLRLVKDIPQSTAVDRTVLGPRKANRRTKKKPLRSTNKEKIAGAPIDKKPLFDGSDENLTELFKSNETHYELFKSNKTHYELFKSNETHYELFRSDKTHYELFRSNKTHYELFRSNKTHYELFRSNKTHYELFRSNETHYELFRSDKTHYELCIIKVLPPNKQEDADDSLGVQINIVPEESDSLDDATKEALSVFNNMVAEADQPETVPEEVPEPEEPCQLPDLTVACAGTDQSLDRDSLDSQVDCMQTDLDTLKELLKGENYSLDANTLLGVCPSSLGLRHQLELHQVLSTILASLVSPSLSSPVPCPYPPGGTTLVKNQTAGYREIEEVALRVSHSSLMSSDRMKPGSGDWALFNEDPLTYDDIPPAENDGDEANKQTDDSGRSNRRRTVATQS
uniref:Uncharacterized protein n=1 Tax=Timema poppense TaxID=170557 RepID=A0A7R9HGD0_TIMPO|nr:unnamed protein product [Timema poppensis]